ncbi:MarR family winged helix-turn-helix transcriptional regulator [Thalassobacillus hwangdonensis]|uniref:MarR family winged helix-turn-helix transcriptional regulator n=1 Tax=Thalassobacillus hwangdonensis TaxID=546108 RepID=A0ABW3L1S2_9BACI
MKREIDHHLGYNINIISHLIKNIYNEKLSEFGLTTAQAKVLYFLSDCGAQTQSELQQRLYIKASSINGILDSLLKKELITKTSSAEDKRTKVIDISDKGKQLDNLVWNTILEIENMVSEGFSESERATIMRWLHKMKANIQPVTAGREQQ